MEKDEKPVFRQPGYALSTRLRDDDAAQLPRRLGADLASARAALDEREGRSGRRFRSAGVRHRDGMAARMGTPSQSFASSRRRLSLALSALSTVFVGGGIVLLLYVVALQNHWLPIGDFTLPDPVALQEAGGVALAHDGDEGAEMAMGLEAQNAVMQRSATQGDGDAIVPEAGLRVANFVRSLVGGPAPARQPGIRAQGPEVVEGPLPAPGVASKLMIPAIGLTANAVAGGPIKKDNGESEWQTLPFVAVHYAEFTGLVGAKANPVLAGHVVTLSQGNVFRDLYRVLPGDRLFVQTENGGTFAYQVSGIRLVDPKDVEVMAPSADAEITLITCAGTFDARSQSFNKRLIVTGSLIGTSL